MVAQVAGAGHLGGDVDHGRFDGLVQHGAQLLDDWRICRVTGDALTALR
mgnify:CR=1 FL=1